MAVSFPNSLSSVTQAAGIQGYKNAAANAIEQLRYPQARLDESSDYLEIKVLRYKPPGVTLAGNTLNLGNSTQNISKQQELLSQILLPIPQSITDSNSVTWGEDGINPLEAAATALTANAMGSKDHTANLQNTINQLQSTALNSVVSGGAQKLIISALSAQAVGSLGANVSATSILGRSTGYILNPNLELLFQNVNLRSFPFVFEFAPRDNSEAQVVKRIIRTFKKAMSPKSGKAAAGGIGLFVGPPDVFQLTYKKGSSPHPFLNKFKPMVLSSMDVNYTASGTYATYVDGTPVHMQLTLSFKELNPIYSDDYTNSDTGVGY
jgi:hypothetical protein